MLILNAKFTLYSYSYLVLVILQVIFAGTKDNELNELLQLSKGCTLQHTANKI